MARITFFLLIALPASDLGTFTLMILGATMVDIMRKNSIRKNIISLSDEALTSDATLDFLRNCISVVGCLLSVVRNSCLL
jgi:hypothetical protein